MNDNILKKYSAPVTSVEQGPSCYCYIVNKNYNMSVDYTDGKISSIKVQTHESAFFNIYANPDRFKQFCYRISDSNDLSKKGFSLIRVSDDPTDSIDIEKYCTFTQRISRLLKREHSQVISMNKASLFEPKNESWLQEHNLYNQLVDTQALLDSLSELCLGHQITQKQLINLMETGELFRSEEERLDYIQRVSELQKNMSELNKRIDDSVKLENSLKEQFEKSIQEEKALVSERNSLYNKFITDMEME